MLADMSDRRVSAGFRFRPPAAIRPLDRKAITIALAVAFAVLLTAAALISVNA